MPFGFGTGAPRFPSTPQPTSVGADPERGYGEYSTFKVPSQKPIFGGIKARFTTTTCNEHNYSQFLDKYEAGGGKSSPLAAGSTVRAGSASLIRARREAKRSGGTGNADRFSTPVGSLLGPGEYEPELSTAGSTQQSRPQSRVGDSRPQSVQSMRSGSAPPARPGTPGGVDAWRMTFSSTNIAAKISSPPNAFSMAADSVTSRTSFLRQRMTKSDLSMHCSETENMLWRTRPTTYLHDAPQVKASFNKRINALRGQDALPPTQRRTPNSLTGSPASRQQ